jgi:hypothetical protein
MNSSVTHDEFIKNANAILDLYLDGAANETVAEQAFNKLHEQRRQFFTVTETPPVRASRMTGFESAIYDHEKEGM